MKTDLPRYIIRQLGLTKDPLEGEGRPDRDGRTQAQPRSAALRQ